MKKRMVIRALPVWILLLGVPLIAAGPEGNEGKGVPPAERAEGPEDAADRRTVTLSDMVITARRKSHHYVQDTVPPEELIGARKSPTVEGLLQDMAGVQLSRKSFSGSDSSMLRIRGFDESRSLVLMNGSDLHGSGIYGGYYVDWTSLSLEDVEAVEIIRGAGPAKYGNTIGGVVDILTRKGTGEPRTVIRSTGGSMGTWDAQVTHSGSAGPMSYSLSASHYETDGYLRNSSVERDAFAGRISLKLPSEMKVSVGVRFTESECGMTVYNMPDSPYYDGDKPKSLETQLGGPYVPFLDHGSWLWGPNDWGDGSYWEDQRWRFDVEVSKHTKTFDFSLKGHSIRQEREEYFYAIDDPRHLVLRRDSEPEKDNRGWRLDCRNLIEGTGRHTLEYGFEDHRLGYGDVDVPTVDAAYFPPWGVPGSFPGKTDISRRGGGYVQDLWRINERFEIEAGVRYDSFKALGPEWGAVRVSENKWSPRLALTTRPWKGGRVTARYARAYRFPTLPEYYWWYSGFQPVDRKDLTSEKADQWELEVGHEWAPQSGISIRAYQYAVDDYIRTIYGYMPSRVIYNIDKVDFQGLEIEFAHALPRGFSIRANYTVQVTDKNGDVLDNSMELTDELVELPERQLHLGVGYRREGGIEMRLTLRYVDERHAVRGDLTAPGGSELKSVDDYANVDFHLSCPLFNGEGLEGARFMFAVENILDRDYEEEYGFPMPGVTFMAGVSLTF